MKRIGSILVVALVLAVSPTEIASSSTARARPPAIPVFSRVLDRNVTPSFPVTRAQKRKLAVLSQGAIPNPVPESGYALPFVVRNGTSHPIGNLQAIGTIKSSAGKVVGSGSDQGFNPTRLLPGQEAFAFIFIQNGSGIPPGSTMKITLSSQQSSSPNTYFADLVVSGSNNTGQQLVGLVRNPRKHTIQGPGTVNVYCVTGSGQFMGQANSDTPNIPESGLNAGATSSFSVNLFGTACPTFIVGAAGFDQKYLG